MKGKRSLIWLLPVAFILLLLTPQLLLIVRFGNDIYARPQAVPATEYGIVFGAYVGKDRELSDITRERIEADSLSGHAP